MKQLRSIGIFAIACSAICFIIAVERYVSTIKTAEEVASRMGLELESVSTPIETLVGGLVGILLFIIGGRLLFEAMRKPKDDGMI